MREEPSEMPTVPDSVLVYVHAYGDSRADDDGRSGLRIGELILALRRWAKSIAAPTTQAAPTEPSAAGDTLAIKAFRRFGVGPHTVTPYLNIDEPEGIRGYRFLCDALAMGFENGRASHGQAPAPAAVAGSVVGNHVEALDKIYAVYQRSMGKTKPDAEMAAVVDMTKNMLLSWWGEHREEIRAAMAAAFNAKAAPQPADPQELLPEIARLQRALAFWLPMGPSEDHPLQERIAHDAFLLAGYYGPDEPSAYELGHVALAGTAAPVAQGDALDAPQRNSMNRYCNANMCLETDGKHEHDCPRGRASIDAARAQAKKGGA